ncbi:hypothetical protein PCANC_20543 [Puccinia coronata f. sp. avenae]|uniref:DNA helicase n=1 Tax=Puccinia coronata f. sp. avenae TaxID=200324 RepID=A0A2N5U5P1_9BASI|nr:hypothetical protein PCANC_20543 [Puccinia coronata f. sp. avenae]
MSQGISARVTARYLAGQPHRAVFSTINPANTHVLTFRVNMTDSKELRTWLDGHMNLLKRERASEKEEFDLLTSEKVKRGQTKLLERMGISIGALGVRSTNIGLGGKMIVELERPAQYHTDPKLPYHTLRSGVPVGIIDHEVGSSKPSKKGSDSSDKLEIMEGVVSKVTETSIAVTISSHREDSDQLELPARCRLIKLADTATFDRLEQTMEQLADACENEGYLEPRSKEETRSRDSGSVNKAGYSESGQGPHEYERQGLASAASRAPPRKPPATLTTLTRTLLGIDYMKIPRDDEVNEVSIPSAVYNLNSYQEYALKHALSPCPVTLVFGPPGTGKTHTLVSIIAALYARNYRILIAAASNLAIDNIAERLVGMKLPITRLGHPARVLESLSSSTLEHQLTHSDESEIIRDLQMEINQSLAKLSAQGKDRLRGKARGEVYRDVQELRKDYRQRERGHIRSIISSARIICATAHGAGSRQLENQKFDAVIIDESTQAFEAACWIPILKAKSKLILAGDPLQLPPTVKSVKSHPTKKTQSNKTTKSNTSDKKGKKESETQSKVKKESAGKKERDEEKQLEDKNTPDDKKKPNDTKKLDADANNSSEEDESGIEALSQETKRLLRETPSRRPLMKRPRTLETTMFYRLLKHYPDISCLLNVQYRMHETIMRFPSDKLYESKLKAAESVATHLLKDFPNLTRRDTDGIADPVLLIDTAGSFMFDRDADEGGEGSLMNENEAELVVQRVNALTECGIRPDQIMVISPYAAQVSLLNSLLKHRFPSLAIGSIDSCQGRENEAVIISLCRSNSEGVVGFLNERRRLNVAMTRAKRHLTVIGDSDTLSKGGDFLKLITHN